MKDHFSTESEKYAQFRPHYPSEFFGYLNDITPHKEIAWDCGTGNGQVAFELAGSFDKVFATDISQAQIDQALEAKNIHYAVQPAEKSSFPDYFFDLIIVAQAIHWFDFDKFYAEVRRTGKKDAIICVVGYGRVSVSTEIDQLIDIFYQNVIGPYWDKERKYIDEYYQTVPFPFQELSTPDFSIELEWNLEHFIGYLNTWSAVKKFTSQNNFNPVTELHSSLADRWSENASKKVKFPLLLRVGHL
ncbi:MAG: class I SAM-dependent methyltransferase [Cyclobacteriaceae bacterium]|nr:class I SAM-dependent methyltransferase [Cyclobacteriaceae bacterium SS2]